MSKPCSSQLATCSFIVSCSIEFSFVAPCQCSLFGASHTSHTVSPKFIICVALFPRPTRPIPEIQREFVLMDEYAKLFVLLVQMIL